MKNDSPNKYNIDKNLRRYLAFVLIVWFLNLLFILVDKPNNIGEIGDFFGVSNSLFTALALAYLIYTAELQRIELKLTREEIKNN